MKISELAFDLPENLIAQTPVEPRDSCRLLLLDKNTGQHQDQIFSDLLNLLGPDDVLVFNNSKVIKARLFANKDTGGRVEVFLHKKIGPDTWEVILGGRGLIPGKVLTFSPDLTAEIIEPRADAWLLKFSLASQDLEEALNKLGHVPLPPYIKNEAPLEQYQTVFAQDPGSVAAPTAGLHFTPELISKLEAKGVQTEYITLHVGLGTFKPIKTDDVANHRMHSELASLDQATADRLNQAKSAAKRIIAVGTTSARTLESFNDAEGVLASGTKETDIYIYPPYDFKFVNALITNFHLPDSTLMLLVAALAGKENILAAYNHAIESKYRFFSFGDAMFIY
ncbi:MAG TPA: tRNA preQ1(34) S-adenosylmethionine ribosyltransferase-isomerase QueA [Flavobacterium sp.]|nr:tRNA preQ1(34) S-adenosylmethionine ribosyltransferase-isomerase QueA [Flavobacterium sp.]